MSKTLYDKITDTGRKVAGTALQVGSFHPILNIPYVGTGLGGALFEAGTAIKENKPAKEVLKDAGRGFIIGETIGAIPYVGKGINKVSGGRIGNALDDAGRYISNTKVGQTVGNYAQSAGNAINKGLESAEDFINTKLRNKQIVYHGSPADFNKFDNAYIGTGEGAQAHGYGHYSALDKDVADKRYRNRLKNSKQRSYTIDNVTLDGDYPLVNHNFNPESVIRDTEYYGGKDKLLAKYKNDLFEAREEKARLISKYPDGADPYFDFDSIDEMLYSNADILEKNLKNKIPFLESILDKEIKKNEGQLYKLSIPKDDVMLREGVPYWEQPKKVQKMYKQAQKNKLRERLKEIQESKDFLYKNLEDAKKNGSDRLIYATERMFNDEMPTLNYWIDDISKQLKNIDNNNYFDKFGYKDLLVDLLPKNSSPVFGHLTDKQSKIISERLNNAGIKGISYNGGIDGEARVIFNPDDIDIVRKFYNQPDLYNKILGNKKLWTAGTNLLYDYLNE